MATFPILSRWKLIEIKQQVILSPESPGILFRYTGNGFINYTVITLSMNQIFIILAFFIRQIGVTDILCFPLSFVVSPVCFKPSTLEGHAYLCR